MSPQVDSEPWVGYPSIVPRNSVLREGDRVGEGVPYSAVNNGTDLARPPPSSNTVGLKKEKREDH